ncbi:MAG TPA: hypothetical protein ENI86_07810 [Acidimicrobiales bacterium]|nr:hypothetical protein [Acidimicrobiales bacterium]
MCLTESETHRADLCAVDSLSGAGTTLVEGIAFESSIDFDPGSQNIVFTDGEGDLALMSVESGEVTPIGVAGTSPGFVAAGKIAAVTPDGGAVLVVDPVTGEVVRRIEVAGRGGIGPDEKIFGFDMGVSGELYVELYLETDDGWLNSFVVVSPEGEVERLVPLGDLRVGSPDVDPSGERLAVTIDGVITVTDLELNPIVRLSRPDWVSTTPDWSPAGDLVVWLSNAVPEPVGPVAVVMRDAQAEFPQTVVVGSGPLPLHSVPVFPTW